MKNPFLIGEKIYLRPLEREDAPLLVPWVNAPEVRQGLRIFRPLNLTNEEEFVQQIYQSQNDIVLGIALQGSDRLLGSTGLHGIDWKNRHAQFGILIGDPAEWGKGYGTEATTLMTRYAFDTLNLNRVWLHVYANNPRGMRAYEKAGFQREGVLRQEFYHEGRYWDIFVMGVLREEWKQKKTAAEPAF